MATKIRIKLTPFELEIMSVLWELGKGSVREIMELLPETRRPAYTTVQTIVYRLEEKGSTAACAQDWKRSYLRTHGQP